MPISFYLVGNPLFELKPGDDGRSPISLSLGDRLLYSRTLGYRDVTDDNLRTFAALQGDFTEDVLDYVVTAHRHKGATRSLRLLKLALQIAQDYADGSIVSPEHLRRAFRDQVDEGRRIPAAKVQARATR
jgi:hypothetical protein